MGISEEIVKDIVKEMDLAGVNGDDITFRLNLSDGNCIEIWYDKEKNYHTWSSASFGYDDIWEVIGDIAEYLKDRDLEAADMETI